ncbi:MAG: DUF58 domain-containing protein, partial [Spirochaetaceae bacterium]|nr:DUF58 domain-containing protein [Spirochaetaceae bacterium]
RRSGEERVRRDSFTGHRPYAPGDDPRRINWKLYGHLGDLFVREGEPEPPPLSRLTILIDTQYDPRLYTPEGGSRGVDLLCENALALITECLRLGMEAELGYSGGSALISGTAPDFAAALAHPAALAFHGEAESAELPAAGDRVLVLALPREEALESGLDRFLRSRGPTDLVFLRQDDGQGAGETAAEACAAYYARRPGLRVSSLLLPPALDGVK